MMTALESGIDFVAAAGRAELSDARRLWLATQLKTMEESGVIGLEEALVAIDAYTSPETFAVHPDLWRVLLAIDVAENLARTIRAGLFDEFGWPEYEEAYTYLDQAGPSGALPNFVNVNPAGPSGAFPNLVIHNGRKAIVLGLPEGVAEYDILGMHALRERIVWAAYLAGELLVTTYVDHTTGDAKRGCWSGHPETIVEFASHPVTFTNIVECATNIEGVGTTLGGRAFVAGSSDLIAGRQRFTREYVFDGVKFWGFVKRPSEPEHELFLREFDVRTGAKGPRSWPAFAESYLEGGKQLLPESFSLGAAPAGLSNSPLGIKDGLIGFRARKSTGASPVIECESIDGTRMSFPVEGAHEAPIALLRFPGSAPLAVVQATRSAPLDFRPSHRPHNEYRLVTDRLVDVARIMIDPFESRSPWNQGWGGVRIPLVKYWHFLKARDEMGSHALRRCTSADARALLDDVSIALDGRDGERGERAQAPEAQAALSAHFPAVTHPKLRIGLAAIAHHAARLERQLERAKARRQPSASVAFAAAADLLTDEVVREVLGGIVSPVEIERVTDFGEGGATYGVFSEEVRGVSNALTGAADINLGRSLIDWPLWIGKARGLAFLAVSPGTPATSRSVIVRILRFWMSTAFAGDLASLRVVTTKCSPIALDSLLARSRNAQSPLRVAGASRYFMDRTLYQVPAHSMFVEASDDGVFRTPGNLAIECETRFVGRPPERPWIASFLELLDARPPTPWDPQWVEKLMAETGLERPEATLLLAGGIGKLTRVVDYLDKERRALLGITLGDVRAGRRVFRRVSPQALLGIYAAAMPDDPRAVFVDSPTPFTGLTGAVSRLATAWNANMAANASGTGDPQGWPARPGRPSSVKVPPKPR